MKEDNAINVLQPLCHYVRCVKNITFSQQGMGKAKNTCSIPSNTETQ